jgi:hypothetical protein
MQEAARQGQAVTGVEHLLKVLMDDAGYAELTELLDRRGVSWRPPEELTELASRIHQLVLQKADAANRQDHEAAANVLREENRLRDEYRRAETVWIASLKRGEPPQA